MPFLRAVAVWRHRSPEGAAAYRLLPEKESNRSGAWPVAGGARIYLALVGVWPKRRRKQRLKYDTSLNPLIMAISLTRMSSLCL